MATSVRPGKYYRNKKCIPGVPIQFSIFISIISKYTKARNCSKVELDATVEPDTFNNRHKLKVICIRDTRIREGKEPIFLPGFQEGIWEYWLEDALINGIIPEILQEFRERLNLLPQHNIQDKDFFHKPIDIPF